MENVGCSICEGFVNGKSFSALHSGFWFARTVICGTVVLSEDYGLERKMFDISADSPYFGDYLDELEQLGIWSDDEDFWLDYEDYDED